MNKTLAFGLASLAIGINSYAQIPDLNNAIRSIGGLVNSQPQTAPQDKPVIENKSNTPPTPTTTSSAAAVLQAISDKNIMEYSGAGCSYDINNKTYLWYNFSVGVVQISGAVVELTPSGETSKSQPTTYKSKNGAIQVSVNKNGNTEYSINGNKTLLKTKERCGSD